MMSTKEGIETHRWGYYIKADNKLIATCLAKTLYKAEEYFDDIELSCDDYVEIRILNQNKDESTYDENGNQTLYITYSCYSGNN